MIYLEFLNTLKNMFVSIFNKLGLTGTAILILLLVTGFEYHVIGNRNDTITILKNGLVEQNKSIDDANKARDEALGRIKDAQDKNAILDAQNQDLLRRLNSKPLAKTCPDSMLEVKNSSLQNAQIWNAGRK